MHALEKVGVSVYICMCKMCVTQTETDRKRGKDGADKEKGGGEIKWKRKRDCCLNTVCTMLLVHLLAPNGLEKDVIDLLIWGIEGALGRVNGGSLYFK